MLFATLAHLKHRYKIPVIASVMCKGVSDLIESELLVIERTKDFPAIGSDGWEMKLLSRLLTEVSPKGEYRGSLYSEPYSDNGIIYVANDQEKMLTKRVDAKEIIQYNPGRVGSFISYISKSIFKLESGTMCAGFLNICFTDEDNPRRYTVFSRRNRRLGDFIQIDECTSSSVRINSHSQKN